MAPVCSGVGVGMTACTTYGPYACSTGSDALIWAVVIAAFDPFLDSVRLQERFIYNKRMDIWISEKAHRRASVKNKLLPSSLSKESRPGFVALAAEGSGGR